MNEADRSDGVVKIYWKMYSYGKKEIFRLRTCSPWMMGLMLYVVNVKRFNTNMC